MTEDRRDEVYEYIRENEPVDQDEVESEFGKRGLRHVRRLMQLYRVSYNLDWELQTND